MGRTGGEPPGWTRLFVILLLGRNGCAEPEAQNDAKQCDVKLQLGRALRIAYSRLLAVQCAKGAAEKKTKQLGNIFEPLDAVAKFCGETESLDPSQLHIALWDIQNGINDGKTEAGPSPTQTARFEIGHNIRRTFAAAVCAEPERVQAEIEKTLTRARDMSLDSRRLFGFAPAVAMDEHCSKVAQMIASNNMIWTRAGDNEPTAESLSSPINMEHVFHRIQQTAENTQLWIFTESPFLASKPFAVGVAAMAQTKNLQINVLLVDADQITRDIQAIWRSIAKSTYGTVYQVPSSLLQKLAPMVCHGTRSDQVLINSGSYGANKAVVIPVDSSIQKLALEISGSDIDFVQVETPSGNTFEPVLNLKVDFNNLKYYEFENVAVGEWKVTVFAESGQSFKVTASAVAAINFQYAYAGKELESHTFHNDNGHSLTVGDERFVIDSGSKYISSVSPKSAIGEVRVSFESENGHLKRMRRATRPIFHPVSKTGAIVPGRTNVFFYRAENEGEELTFDVTCTMSQWEVTISPTETSPMSAYTDLEISVAVPHHAKSGTEALISLSASNGKTVVGSNSFQVHVSEQTPPTTRAIKVKTAITNRFVRTSLSALAENTQNSMGEAPFRAIIPSKAFVRSFSIITAAGRVYKSRIVPAFEHVDMPDAKLKFASVDAPDLSPEELKKAEAETPLHHAQQQQEVMLVDTIDAGEHRIVQVKQAGQHLMVRASVEPYSNLTYVLEYVEVLERNRGLYRYGIHFDPEYTADDISVQIAIEDADKIKMLRPIPRQSAKVRGEAKVRFSKDYHKAAVDFAPKNYNNDRYWFGIEFDVDQVGCSVFTDAEYFVERCRPSRSLFPRQFRGDFGINVIFVIDASGSMWGDRIAQTRQAFKFMLEDLKAGDSFNVVTFESEASIFAAERMVPVNDKSIFAALKYMDQIDPGGGTNIYSALVKALIILAQNKKAGNRENVIYFLTDGAPTAGVTNLEVILNTVRFVAGQNQIAINTIAFGDEVNDDKDNEMKEFLTQLSAQNRGMVLRIPIRPDATYMMQDFYFETLEKAQKRHGIKNPSIVITDESGREITDSITIEEHEGISASQELIIAGKLAEDTFTTKYETKMKSEMGSFTFESDVAISSDTKDYYYAINAHNTLVERERALDDIQHQMLTAEIIDLSLQAGLLTPVVSLQIQKPARNRRSATPVNEMKFKFRRLQRPAKVIEAMNLTDAQGQRQDLADHDQPAIAFFEGITRIHTDGADFCFTLPQRRSPDALILLRSGNLMATATVSFNGLETVSLSTELKTILEFSRYGITNANYTCGEEIALRNGHAFVLEQKVQFLLDDGMKFEVVWGDEYAVNVLNPGHKSTGLISSLARVGATGKISGPMISLTNQIPVEILGFYTVGNEISVAGRKCLLLADLDEFLKDAEHSGQL